MAIILYLERQENGQRIKVIPHDEAVKLIHAMNHPELVTDEVQLAKLARIQDIYLGRTGGREDVPLLPKSGLVG